MLSQVFRVNGRPGKWSPGPDLQQDELTQSSQWFIKSIILGKFILLEIKVVGKILCWLHYIARIAP